MKSEDLNTVTAAATAVACDPKTSNPTKTAARQFVDKAGKLKLRLLSEEHEAAMVAMTIADAPSATPKQSGDGEKPF